MLEQALPAPTGPPADSPHLLLLSARSDTALERAAEALSAHLAAHPALPLADVAHTLRVGRTVFAHRAALVARDAEEAARGLSAPALIRATAPAQPPAVAFLFPGQGSRFPRMGEALYRSSPAYREALDRCPAGLEPHIGADLRDLLHGPEDRAADADALRRTALAQPALFAVGYATAHHWLAQGVEPAAMLGHSVGEYVAACLAGVLTLDDALALVAERGRLVDSLPARAMLALPLAEDEAAALLTGTGLSIAAVNGPRQVVAAGPIPAVTELERALDARGVRCRRLETSHAFHSAMFDPVVPLFAQRVAALTLRDGSAGLLLEAGPGHTLCGLARGAGWDRPAVTRVLGGDALLVDVEGHGRDAPVPGVDLTRTVGWFTTIAPVVLPVSASPMRTLAAAKAAVAALPGRGFSYGALRAMNPSVGAALAALEPAEVVFNYHGQWDQSWPTALPVRPAAESEGPGFAPTTPRPYRLEVAALVMDGRLRMDWTYDPRQTDPALVERLADAFATALTALLDEEAPHRLAPQQAAMLAHASARPDSEAYAVQLAATLPDGLDVDAFQGAWGRALSRHAALRAAFVIGADGVPEQHFSDRVQALWRLEDWSALDPAAADARFAAWREQDRHAGFDPAAAPWPASPAATG